MTVCIGGKPLPVVGRARMYVCGITPYDTTHLGHAATFVWLDVARRVLEARGLQVDVCRNITDVDDDILAQAAKRGVDYRVLGTEQTFCFEEDMRHLRVPPPTFEPRSRDFVDEVVALAAGLLERGAAYERNGTVYFRAAGVAGHMGDLDRDGALALAAEHGGHPEDPDKDDPLDAPVWQRSRPGEPSWPSPWGDGRPGWHAECSAMAMSLLGTSLDVHGGGIDLRFPHHAYEAAQAEALTGVRPFVRAWMHVGTVGYAGAKMSKSLGNLVYVQDLLERWSPETIRLLLVDRPWAQAWGFDTSLLQAAEERIERLWSAAGRAGGSSAALDAALDALEDDLDVPRALDVAEEAGGTTVRKVGGLLGIL